MTALYLCELLSTFALFAAVCWRLKRTMHPHPTLKCRTEWMFWGALHITIAVAALAWLMDHAGSTDTSENGWSLCAIRMCVATTMAFPWQRRRVS